MAIAVFPRRFVDGSNRFPRLRRGHWSTQGLVYAATFGQGTPGGIFPSLSLSARSFSSETAQGLAFTSTSDLVVAIPVARTTQLPTQRVTVLCVRQKADTTNRASTLFGIEEQRVGGAVRLGAHVPYNDATVYWDFGGNSAPNRLTASYTSTTEVEAWTFVAGLLGSSIWRNGQLLNSQSTALTRVDEDGLSGSSGNFLINTGNGGIAGDLQDIWLFAVLDAEWIAPQVSDWAANPWILFDTPSLPVSTVAVGGGGGGAAPRALYHMRQQGMA